MGIDTRMKYVFTTLFSVNISQGVTKNEVIRTIIKEFESHHFSVEKIKATLSTSVSAEISIVAIIDAFESKVSNTFEFIDVFPNFSFHNIQVKNRK